MADLLKTGSSWMNAQRHAHMSTGVTYVRGASSVPLAATVGQTVFEQADEHGLLRTIESRDFIFQRADLVLGASQALPIAGDRIREADVNGTQVHVYQVTSFNDGPPFRFSDRFRESIRVHTKHVAIETVV